MSGRYVTLPLPSSADMTAALLVLLRVSSMLVFLPVLGSQLIPAQAKIGLAGIITLVIYPVVRSSLPVIPASPVVFILIAGQEILIGAMLAMMARLIFAAVQLAGQIISYEMGIAIANVFNPATSSQIAIVGQFAIVLAMLVWLAVGGHHVFLEALFDSFRLMPMGHPLAADGWAPLNDAAAAMFALGLRLSAPILLLLLFVYVALGLMSRAVPQIQVFFVSFPLTIGLGLLAFSLSMPVFILVIRNNFSSLSQYIPQFLRVLAGH